MGLASHSVNTEYSPESLQILPIFRSTGEHQDLQLHPQLLETFQIEQLVVYETSGETLSHIE